MILFRVAFPVVELIKLGGDELLITLILGPLLHVLVGGILTLIP
jgi:hypothetical protein